MKTKKTKQTHRNPNKKIILNLEIVKQYYEKLHNNIHVNAYDRAIKQIQKYPHKINNGSELLHLDGIGKGMVQKIDTIIKTGTLPIITQLNLTKVITHKNSNNTTSLQNILGFGKKQSIFFKEKYNIDTIQQLQKDLPILLKQNPNILTNTQRLGLLHHNDLIKPIPRQHITVIGDIIKNILSILPSTYSFIAGSYPSQLKTHSKDIDIIITSHNINMAFQTIINTLQKYTTTSTTLSGKHTLAKYSLAKHSSEKHFPIDIKIISLGKTKLLGLIKHHKYNIWHHIDIRFIPLSAFPYTWFYFTGGKIFNKIIREKIKKKGFKLNEYGLFKNNNKIILPNELSINELNLKINNEDELMQYTQTIEKEIFNIANMTYKTIQERYI